MRWKDKKKLFQKNKIVKTMRALQRANKKKARKHHCNKDIIYSTETSRILCEKKFYSKSVSDYVLIKMNGTVLITIPKDFSISKNADEVIYLLKKIFYCGMQPQIKEIMFDHSRCSNLGIAASTIMDTIVLAAKSYHKTLGSDLTISGNLPEDRYTKDVFIASGLVKHLNMNQFTKNDNIIKFKLISGRAGAQESAQVATKLTNYFNTCLQTQGYKLTDTGENKLASMFGEVIDNCERHGGRSSVWYTLGHYQIRDEYDWGEIQLTIFNFGDSIYERLCGADTTTETKMKLQKMVSIHEPFFSKDWTKEMMFSVFSLQEGISRLRDSNREGYSNRGKGTITLMDTFYHLGQTRNGIKPELTIVSGHTCIRLDNKYRLEKKRYNDEIFQNKERRIIAFNKDNDIYKKADSNVELLKDSFPGTVIAMKFYLDKKYLDSVIKEDK